MLLFPRNNVFFTIFRQFHTSSIIQRNRGVKRYKVHEDKPKSETKWKAKRKANPTEIVEKIPQHILDEFNSRKPVDDVWLYRFYPTPFYDIANCIDMHRQVMQPEIFNLPDAIVYLKCKLDLRTKKPTKFMVGSSGTILLPKLFDYGVRPKIVAFCKTSADKEMAERYNVAYYGSTSVITGIEKGEIHQEDYDVVLAAADMLTDILPLRKILKDQFPNQKLNTLSSDFEAMLKLYTYGINYKSVKETENEESTSTILFPIGRLNMKNDDISNNLQAFIDKINKEKTVKTIPWPYVKEAVIECPPSTEKFKLNDRYLLTTPIVD